ncbi:P1 family peptidase [Pararhodobacter sp. SW119]|uniref:P1 family peptidase n=1 Tax=Pararhodobacter sp. SW119 TaxID=2780075 RepID=UPI001AE0987C|nr:P1 family peptidase [Pararhodobacter sp. SW119]
MTRPRARDLGLPFPGHPGPLNAITDVPGVTVGFCTLTDPARDLRTGVTAIRPRSDAGLPRPVRAGHFALNGNGEMTGTHWIDDAGYLIGPVMITNTHAVGAVHHGAVAWMIDHYADWFRTAHAWAMPVVAETYDGVLNDITQLAVTPDHARAALQAASGGPVAEGSSGGGNGMIAYGFKGGTGTASRRVALGGQDWTLGALVQANHGIRPWLTVLGRPLGLMLPESAPPGPELGSIIVVLATDAPLSPLALRHLARRAGLGVGRGGSPGGNGSGDIFLALSVADCGPMPHQAGPLLTETALNQEWLDPLYLAAVEAVEEAVINALVAGETVQAVKPRTRVVPALDVEALRAAFG